MAEEAGKLTSSPPTEHHEFEFVHTQQDQFKIQTETRCDLPVTSSPPPKEPTPVELMHSSKSKAEGEKKASLANLKASDEPSSSRKLGKSHSIPHPSKPTYSNTTLSTNHEENPAKQQEEEEKRKRKGKAVDLPNQTAKQAPCQETTMRRTYKEVAKQGTPQTSANLTSRSTIRSTLQTQQDLNVSLKFIHAEPNKEGYYGHPAELETLGLSMWTNTLVGYFVGRKLPFSAVNKIAHLVWDSKGLEDVILQANGVYFFRFADAEHLDNIMSQGQWHFARCPVILRRWHDGISLIPEEPKKMPVWIKLFGIPNTMAHVQGISFIASRFGRPLLTDAISAKQKRLDFARVCVELDAEKGICREGKFHKLNGETYTVKPEYEWMPLHCTTCQVFGHSMSNCQKSNTGPELTKTSMQRKPTEWIQVAKANKRAKNVEGMVQRNKAENEPKGNCENLGSSSELCSSTQEASTPPRDPGKSGMQGNLDTTPMQTPSEMGKCITPPFGPLPPLLAKSPVKPNAAVHNQGDSHRVKSIIIAHEQKNPPLSSDSHPGNSSKTSPPSLQKTKKRVKKKRT